MTTQETDTQKRPDVWHQSRMVWAGVLALILGVILTVGFEDKAGDMGAVFLFGGLICLALYLLRKFFTRS